MKTSSVHNPDIVHCLVLSSWGAALPFNFTSSLVSATHTVQPSWYCAAFPTCSRGSWQLKLLEKKLLEYKIFNPPPYEFLGILSASSMSKFWKGKQLQIFSKTHQQLVHIISNTFKFSSRKTKRLLGPLSSNDEKHILSVQTSDDKWLLSTCVQVNTPCIH